MRCFFQSSVETYVLTKKIINRQKVDMQEVNIYMGFLKAKKFYIVESYYHIDKNYSKIKSNLKEAYKITYLSEASKNHTIELFGKESKSYVTYE